MTNAKHVIDAARAVAWGWAFIEHGKRRSAWAPLNAAMVTLREALEALNRAEKADWLSKQMAVAASGSEGEREAQICAHSMKLRCYVCYPLKRFLVDPPRGSGSGSPAEFDTLLHAQQYAHDMPRGTRIVDRAPVQLADEECAAFGEGDETK